MNRLLLLSIAACTLATSAQAKDPTMDCLRTKIWDTYSEGWSVRSSSDAEVGFGQTSFFKVTLLKGAPGVDDPEAWKVRRIDVLELRRGVF